MNMALRVMSLYSEDQSKAIRELGLEDKSHTVTRAGNCPTIHESYCDQLREYLTHLGPLVLTFPNGFLPVPAFLKFDGIVLS